MSRHDLKTGHQTTAETLYTFENSGTQVATRFSALADIFDPGTIRHLTEIGVDSGWHCLEIGAGGGSIATWLCDRVGGKGQVLATDIDTRFLEALNRSNLEVSRHDIASDPLPQAKFDLVHFRLVFRESTQLGAPLKNAPGISSLRTGCFCVIWRSVTRFLSGISLLRPAGFGSIACFASPRCVLPSI